ncbi:putative uncharacterized protein CXorf58 homolog isoform X2 [Rousettus aegyptiacus]|uniref:Uncharacterized protein n=1 Tax=Rousettus aegyptiacus TaxID=9407 RepID=A0A7J8EIE5_ROUAE|nr:putative uncharacterized protein CXorf58 homolog isoform X2 [Rousettus aegyptiacus]KAF6435267.1 hypothetical protein HJG63_003544 [Rousettus aegyptiacus]
MSRSSKPPVTGVRKSDNPSVGKGRKAPLSNTGKTKVQPPTHKDISALTIQRAWLSHMDKTVFQLLKHTICAVEDFGTHEILKKLSPLEAKLVNDPSMNCKVRFRFSGETFPPCIVFKIFLHNQGHGYKYFSGKNILKPSSKEPVDAYKIMGRKTFHAQIMEDVHFSQKFRVADEIDIVTLKDYIQYSSLLDETPASSGGRNNCWRRLNLKNIPKTTLMYDIVDYAESGVISNRLHKEMKYLSQKPKTEEMRQDQLRVVSKVRHSSSLPSKQTLCQPCQQQYQMKHLGRRSKQALMKAERMKKAYKIGKAKEMETEPQTDAQGAKPQKTVVFSTSSFEIVKIKELKSSDKLGKKKKGLFTWCQDLRVHHSSSC